MNEVCRKHKIDLKIWWNRFLGMELNPNIGMHWIRWIGLNLLKWIKPSEWIEFIVIGWKFCILLRIGGQKDWIAQICTQLYVIRKHDKYIRIRFSIILGIYFQLFIIYSIPMAYFMLMENNSLRFNLTIDEDREQWSLDWLWCRVEKWICWNFEPSFAAWYLPAMMKTPPTWAILIIWWWRWR